MFDEIAAQSAGAERQHDVVDRELLATWPACPRILASEEVDSPLGRPFEARIPATREGATLFRGLAARPRMERQA